MTITSVFQLYYLKFSSRQVKENQRVACSSVVPFLFVFVFATRYALDGVFDLNVIVDLIHNLSSLKNEILNQVQDDFF